MKFNRLRRHILGASILIVMCVGLTVAELSGAFISGLFVERPNHKSMGNYGQSNRGGYNSDRSMTRSAVSNVPTRTSGAPAPGTTLAKFMNAKDQNLIDTSLDLSRFSAAPGAHLSGDPFKSQGAFPA
jgi:hypothetical protein